MIMINCKTKESIGVCSSRYTASHYADAWTFYAPVIIADRRVYNALCKWKQRAIWLRRRRWDPIIINSDRSCSLHCIHFRAVNLHP